MLKRLALLLTLARSIGTACQQEENRTLSYFCGAVSHLTLTRAPVVSILPSTSFEVSEAHVLLL